MSLVDRIGKWCFRFPVKWPQNPTVWCIISNCVLSWGRIFCEYSFLLHSVDSLVVNNNHFVQNRMHTDLFMVIKRLYCLLSQFFHLNQHCLQFCVVFCTSECQSVYRAIWNAPIRPETETMILQSWVWHHNNYAMHLHRFRLWVTDCLKQL